MRFEARKVIRAAPQINDSAAEVLDPPIIVCRAKGTCVTPMVRWARSTVRKRRRTCSSWTRPAI
jgi:hypothetical protein